MNELKDIAALESGSPQFRIKESLNAGAPIYRFYGQVELDSDLIDRVIDESAAKQIRTADAVSTLQNGDLVFSLISGKATIVRPSHDGYLFTQNYVRVVPEAKVNPAYLAYTLNEDNVIKKQLHVGQQGSATMKYTIKQLSELLIPKLPSVDTQRTIGELYFNQLKLTALKKHQAELEARLVLGKMKGAC